MAKAFAFMVLLARLVLSQEKELITVNRTQLLLKNKGSPSYSFGYGVSDTQTGDVKTVWESKDGDTVKGHYIVLEADGSVRTVEYSASPGKGFTAAVNNDGMKSQTPVPYKPKIEDKSFRDYIKPYDYSEDLPSDFYSSNDKRNKKRPYDSYDKEYPTFKRPTYVSDSELRHPDFLYNLPPKHLYDDSNYDRDLHRHIGFTHDGNCKIRHMKDRHKEAFPFNYDKYPDSYNEDADKYTQRHKLKAHNNLPRPDEIGLPTSLKYSNPGLTDVPSSENFYRDEILQRWRKRFRSGQNIVKRPSKGSDINDYPQDSDEDYDNPDYDEEKNYKLHRGKKVTTKIVKKRKPSILKFFDILDI